MSSNPSALNKKYILLNNLSSKHSLLIKFGQFIFIEQKKAFYQELLQLLQPENYFQATLCLQRVKHNFY